MHAHEKQIIEEVLKGTQTVHLLYSGARLRNIAASIVARAKGTLVVVGGRKSWVQKIHALHPQLPSKKKGAKRPGKTLLSHGSGSSHPQAPSCVDPDTPRSHIAVKEITQQMTGKARQAAYSREGCVIVQERLFLMDILKERVPKNTLKVLYLMGEDAAPSQKDVREFVWYAAQNNLSVLAVWDNECVFGEIVRGAYAPSSGIFLYPVFRHAVSKAMGDFHISETQIKTDPLRAQIQLSITGIAKKVAGLTGKELFGDYIHTKVQMLRYSITLLFNAEAQAFFQHFANTVDTQTNLCVLEMMYGSVENEYKRDAKYGGCLSWTLLSEVEEALALGKALAESEAISPKRKVLEAFVKNNPNSCISILACRIEKDVLPPVCGTHPILPARYIQRETQRITKHPDPHVVLLNYTVDALRRIKMARKRWLSRGVAIAVSIITMTDSLEELHTLEDLQKEKDVFISAIGIKKNRPKFIEKPLFSMTPAHRHPHVLSIDFRELRSSLAFFLARKFSGQFRLEVEGLPQGDYVLNSTYFVERKSMPDLIDSFRTGRLFKQMENIVHRHSAGYLLVEYPEGEKLSLCAYATARTLEIDLVSSVVRLVQTIPRVSVFFSNALGMSSSFIAMLARKPPKPSSSAKDLAAPENFPARKDVPPRGDAPGSEPGNTLTPWVSMASHPAACQHMQQAPRKEDTMIPQIIECLLAIPGVTHQNVGRVLENFSSLFDLATSSRERLSSLLPDGLGPAIYEFFNSLCREEDRSGKAAKRGD